MLIYNYKKEFLGIDQSDLEILGLSNLSDLHKEAADFADLFVKTPGYVHNFEHVHWIDYISCSESGVESKAIINIKSKNYSANIDIQTLFLADNPSQKAFIVNLTNVKPLSHAQSEKISADILERPAPKTAADSAKPLTQTDELEDDVSQPSDETYEPVYAEASVDMIEDVYDNEVLEVDLGEDTFVGLDEERLGESVSKEKARVKAHEIEPEDETAESAYVFNPHVASEELGLPIDIVEEFIQDFIAQADSFKADMYKSAKDSDFDSLKILSHKLKGVAANLRVEDALETLSVINSSHDLNEIKKNLDKLYKIFDKLSNKDYSLPRSVDKIQAETKDEEFILSLKDDVHSELVSHKQPDEFENLAEDIVFDVIDDSDVPSHIDILELEDDEFLKQDISLIDDDFDYEELSILDEYVDDESCENPQEEALEIAMSYDKELIANDIGVDIDSFNELFSDYIGESKELTDSIASAIKNDNLDGCKSATIKLKGMSENMRLHQFDNELNTIIKSSSVDGLSECLDAIVSKLSEISSRGN